MSAASPRIAFWRTTAAGLAALVLLFGALGGWAATARIGGAIIAPGQIIVRGKPQEVQHLDGGLIAAIHVAEGDRVGQGDVLLTLDATALELRRDGARDALGIELARAARLAAEEAGAETIDFTYPDLPVARPDMARYEADARRLFAARTESRAGRTARLAETQADLDARISGTERQMAALDEGIALIDADLDRLRALANRQLARQTDLSALLRDRAGLAERRDALLTEAGRLAGAKATATSETDQAARALQEEIVTAHAEARAKARTHALEILDLEARLARVDIRAPSAGIVHDMQVATAGGVVTPGGTILQIVPQDRGVEFEIRIDPRQVDQVLPGQSAEVIVAAFDPRSTPRLEGQVVRVSPDTVTDPRTNFDHFRATVAIGPEELARLGDAVLVPGMPVEAYLKTTDRTVAAYLVEPLTNSMRHAMRE